MNNKNIKNWILAFVVIVITIVVVFSVLKNRNKQLDISGNKSIETSIKNDQQERLIENKKEKSEIKSNPTSFFSLYSDLSQGACKTIREDLYSAGYVEDECLGVGGYQLILTEQDLRQNIKVLAPNGKIFDLNFFEKISPAFSVVGEKAEWRIAEENGKDVPKSIIIRFTVDETGDNGETKTKSYLTITKISSDEICLVAKVEPSADQNVKARKIADDSENMQCLKE